MSHEILSAQVVAPSIGGVLVLIVGQLVSAPPEKSSLSLASEPIIEKPVEKKRNLSLHGGQYNLVPDDHPLIGSVDAEKLIVSLFDYTCTHCRETHEILVEGQKRLGSRLGIISLPTPLDNECNVTLQALRKPTPSSHIDACKIAKVAMVVWELNRERYYDFEAEMFLGRNCPPLNLVIKIAERYVEPTMLEAALKSPSLSDQLQVNTSIFHTNYTKNKKGSLPQLMIGSSVSFGTIHTVEELFEKLSAEFGPAFVAPAKEPLPGS